MQKKMGFLICILAICMFCLSLCENTYAVAEKSSIKLNKSKATIYTSGNKTIQLKATVEGASKKVTWKSSNKKIATVNSKGKVTAKKAGVTNITAKANGKTAKCKVIVKQKIPTKKEVYKIYKKYLSKNQSNYNYEGRNSNTESYKTASAFFVVDLDKNGIPDLVTVHPMGWKYERLYIFTYKNGKVIKVNDNTGKNIIEMSHVANGMCWAYVCNKNHLHKGWNGLNPINTSAASNELVYMIKNGKLKLLAKIDDNYTKNGKTIYTVNGRQVKKQKYKSATKNCKISYYAYSNDYTNRNKVFH